MDAEALPYEYMPNGGDCGSGLFIEEMGQWKIGWDLFLQLINRANTSPMLTRTTTTTALLFEYLRVFCILRLDKK